MSFRRAATVVALACTALAACAAQPEPWKLSMRASGTWSAPRNIEIDSSGSLVVQEQNIAPHCAPLDDADLSYLAERIDAMRRSAGPREQSWEATAFDVVEATLTISWVETGETVKLRLPLNRLFRSGAPPPFVAELVEKVWQLRVQTEGPCA